MLIISSTEAPQGGDEWKKLKLGIPSASNFDKIITPTGKPSGQRESYMNKLLGEWLSGEPVEAYKGEWMERGNVLETPSRGLYELINNVEVEEVSLVYKDDMKLIACSPDGLIKSGDSYVRGYETKCPMLSTHIETTLANKMPKKYVPQVQGSMYVTGLDSWDFMSYHPDMPPVIVGVERDTRFIKSLSEELELFIEEMIEKRHLLTKSDNKK